MTFVSSPARRPGEIVPPCGARLKQAYSYDDLDRLSGFKAYNASTQSDGGQWSYDALDRVSSEQETHGTTISRTLGFDYNGLDTSVAKETWTGTNATTKTFSYDAGGNKVGLNDSASANPHGDISQLLTLTGTAQAAYGYRPYGDEETGTGAISQGDLTATNQLNSWRYSGKRFDTAAGAINMGARFFSPDLGSFLQNDCLRDALGNVAPSEPGYRPPAPAQPLLNVRALVDPKASSFAAATCGSFSSGFAGGRLSAPALTMRKAVPAEAPRCSGFSKLPLVAVDRSALNHGQSEGAPRARAPAVPLGRWRR